MSAGDAINIAVDFFEFESSRREARQEEAEAKKQAVAQIELGAQERQLVRQEATQLRAQQTAAAGASGLSGGSFDAAQILSISRSIEEEERILKGRLDVAQAILRRGRARSKARKREGIASLALGIGSLASGGIESGLAIGGALSSFQNAPEKKRPRPKGQPINPEAGIGRSAGGSLPGITDTPGGLLS